jgi:putative DNA primase/helicase
MLTQDHSKSYTKEVELLSLDKVEHHALQWLWPNHIPLSMLTLIAGEPGVGKSFLTLFMAAAVSAGLPWPNTSGIAPPVLDEVDEVYGFGDWKSPGSVLIVNTEDNISGVTCPRLAAMNADMSKIKLVPFVWRNDGLGHDYTALFNITRDMFALERAVDGLDHPKLLIIDPLLSFFGNRDTYRDSQVRASLFPLIRLAERYRVAVVCVVHLNKGCSNKIFNRIMGSLAFSSSARAVWYVHSLPAPENKKRSLFSPAKNNIVENPQTLAFEMKDNRIVFDAQPFNSSPVPSLPLKRNIESPELNRSIDWLKNLLSDGNPLPSKKILALAKENGFKKGVLQRARKKLHINCFPKKDEFGKTYWSWKLPILTKNVCNP